MSRSDFDGMPELLMTATHRHRRNLSLLGAALALGLLFVACGSVPYTDRSQLRLVSDDAEAEMGLEAYQEILKEAQVEVGTPEAQMVERVGRRLAAVTGEAYAWEFKLIRDDATVNAFCLPGGKIAVYTGILPITQTEDGLAAVLGHEIAHATAHHGAERVSQKMVEEGVLSIASATLAESTPMTREIVMTGLGLGSEYGVMLPYSREHEYEADAIGLRYMVRAGYNPHEAVRLWERMAEVGESVPTFLSTHPEPRDRAEKIARMIPKVVAEERGAASTVGGS